MDMVSQNHAQGVGVDPCLLKNPENAENGGGLPKAARKRGFHARHSARVDVTVAPRGLKRERGEGDRMISLCTAAGPKGAPLERRQVGKRASNEVESTSIKAGCSQPRGRLWLGARKGT